MLAVGVSVGAASCGPHAVLACLARRYAVQDQNGNDQLTAVLNPGQENQQSFPFTGPSMIVNQDTHQEIVAEADGSAAQRLRDRLADATRELCRRTLEEDGGVVDVRSANTNCDIYTAAAINLSDSTVEPSAPDPSGAPIQVDPLCSATCLANHCYFDEFPETDSGFDPPPTIHSRGPSGASARSNRLGRARHRSAPPPSLPP